MCAAKRIPFEQEEYGQYIDVDGINVHYYEQGIGTPIIFLHGIGQSMYTFRNNVEDFSACFHVIVPDLLGHGGTDGTDCDFLIEDYSEFLLSFMNAMNIESAHFFAFSTGAIIAMDFALAFPERVKKLILISPGGVDPSFPAAIRSMALPVVSDFRFVFFNRNMIRSALADAYFDKTLITEDVIESYYTALSNPYALDAAMTTLKNWNDTDVNENASAIKASVYIFWGECDEWHPLDNLETFEDALPNCYAATVRNGGHMVHEEKYRELNRKSIELLLTDEIS